MNLFGASDDEQKNPPNGKLSKEFPFLHYQL